MSRKITVETGKGRTVTVESHGGVQDHSERHERGGVDEVDAGSLPVQSDVDLEGHDVHQDGGPPFLNRDDIGGYDRLMKPDGTQVGTQYRAWAMRMQEHLTHARSGSKGILVFSFDDTNPEDYNEILPLMKKHDVPVCFNVNSSRLEDGGTRYGTDADTNDDLDVMIEMLAYGTEFGNHGREARQFDNYDWQGDSRYDTEEEFLRDEILNGQRELQDMGAHATSITATGGSGIDPESEGLDNYESFLIRSSHLVSRDGPLSADKNMKQAVSRYSSNRFGPIENTSLTDLQALVDEAANFGVRREIYGHASGIDWTGSKLDDLFAYADQARRNNDVVIMSATTARLIDYDADDVNWHPHESFENISAFSDNLTWGPFGNDPVLATGGGGHTGSNYVRFGSGVDPNGDGAGYGGMSAFFRQGPPTPRWMVEFWAKATTGNTFDVTVRVEGDGQYPGQGGSFSFDRDYTVGDTWTRCFAPICWPRTEHQQRVILWSTDAEVHVDDLKIYPI